MTAVPSLGFVALVGAATLLSAAPAGAQIAPCTQPPSDPGDPVTFNYSSKPQYVTVPRGVTRIRATAEGAHGGQDNGTNAGGAGGGVDAYVSVSQGECLTVRVGQFAVGNPSSGFAVGGDHGTTPGGSGNGDSSGAGGGATAILRGNEPLVVGGGGGGGGGDGIGTFGGVGGSGGAKPGNGKGGGESEGGSGGCGGCQGAPKGQGGQSAGASRIGAGSGGGGGGGFQQGGKGGDTGEFNGGGGGGGAGASFADDAIFPPHYWTSGRSCPLRSRPSTCNGTAQILWASSPGGPIAPAEPAVRILSTSLDRVLDKGLPVSHATSGGPLKLELHLRGDGSRQPADFTTVDSGPSRDRVVLEPTERAKRLLSDERLVELRLRSEHADGTTVQKLLLK